MTRVHVPRQATGESTGTAAAEQALASTVIYACAAGFTGTITNTCAQAGAGGVGAFVATGSCAASGIALLPSFVSCPSPPAPLHRL